MLNVNIIIHRLMNSVSLHKKTAPHLAELHKGESIMRRNNRKLTIPEVIMFLLMVIALVYFFGAFIFMIVGCAWIIIRFMIQHYEFTILGIIICLILFHCIYCIKQIRRKPTARERVTHGAGHKTFLILHCALDIICLISVITVALTVIIPSIKTTSHQTAETQAVSEYLTEAESEIRLSRIVYISKRGHKIHLSSDCSGMIYYFEMTYEEACEAGYDHCSNCFDYLNMRWVPSCNNSQR